MVIGFAVTRHCNLRCPHCIRDDVTSVRWLETSFILSVVDQGLALFGDVAASLTGGEPLIHPDLPGLIDGFQQRSVPYHFVSNAWHLRRVMPLIDKYPPRIVRLSLSGATAELHDAERGRDSFRRVLLGVALMTSRQVATWLSICIDRRNRHQLRTAVDLAENLGCLGIQFILPQPVPATIERDSDLSPAEWWEVAHEVNALKAEGNRSTQVVLSYGAPTIPESLTCDTFAGGRVYVDPDGCLSLCCQLSDYGTAPTDKVASLYEMSLEEAYGGYQSSLAALQKSAAPRSENDPLAPFPCLRCARSTGKLDWLRDHPDHVWSITAGVGRPRRALPLLAVAG